jgi:D-aspartate ligase
MVSRSREGLRSFLSGSDLDHCVLIPCEDDWVRAIADLMDHDAGSVMSTTPLPSVVERLVDKRAFAQTLDDLDIDRPRTFEVRSVDDLAQIDDDELPSFFLKPHDSQRFVKEFHMKAFPLTTREEAIRLLERSLRGGHEVLAQERISGPPQNHVFLDGFVDRRGRVAGLLARRRIRMFPAGFGNSTDTVTIPLPEVTDAVESLHRLFAGIGFHGMFDAEFKRAGAGPHKIIEVNARPWWQIELARAAGVNVVRMAYADALGQEVEPVHRYQLGRRWVHTFPDLRARWEGPRGWPHAGPHDGWFSARHAVFRWSDPAPGLSEIVRVARVAMGLGLGREP